MGTLALQTHALKHARGPVLRLQANSPSVAGFREPGFHEPGLIAVRPERALVNCERLLQQGFSSGALSRFVHEHSKVRDIGRGFRTVRSIKRRIDPYRAAVKQASFPKFLLIP